MTTLFFSQKRLFVQQLDPSHLRPRLGASFPLEENLLKSIESALWKWKKEHMPYAKRLPVFVVFPMQAYLNDQSDRQAVIQYLSTHEGIDYRGSEHVIASFMRGLATQKQIERKNICVLDALGDFVHIYYHLGRNKPPKADLRKLSGMGWLPGYHRMSEYALKELATQGFHGDRRAERQIMHQVVQLDAAGALEVQQNGEHVEVEGRVSIDQQTFDHLLLGNMKSLDGHLSEDYLHKFNIDYVYLIGDLFDREDFNMYICQHQSFQRFFNKPKVHSDSEVFETVQVGVARKVFKDISPVLDIDTQRKRLMEEIDNSCVDESKRAEYIQAFVERGAVLGIPEAIIRWAVKKQLRPKPVVRAVTPQDNRQALQERLPRESKAEVVPAPSTVVGQHSEDQGSLFKVRESDVPNAISEKKVEKEVFNEAALLNTIHIDEIYSNKGLLFFKGRLKNSNKLLVFRLLKNSDQSDEALVRRFNGLYGREFGYYSGVSPVVYALFGSYYYRFYIEGEPLHWHLRKRGMHEKRNLREFNSGDLKLIFKVWEVVNDLPFATKGLQEGNFIVSSPKKWSLNREPKVHIVGLDASDYTREKMNLDVHQMFERHLGKTVYHRLRDKLGLVTLKE